MLRFTLRKIIAIPLWVLLAGLLAFAYAFYIGPVQASRNPYAFGEINIANFWGKYFDYISNALTLNFGAMPNQQKIIDVIIQTATASLGLLGVSIILSIALGIMLGMSAVKTDPPKVAPWLTLFSIFGQASPGFYIGVLLISLSIVYVIWGSGTQPLLPFQGFGWDAHMILPILALTLQPTVKIAHVTAGLMTEELDKQYVIAARSFGHTLSRIKTKFVLRNISVAVVLTIASVIRLMVAELIIIERLFDWSGIGKLFSSVLIQTSSSDNFLYPPLFATLMMIMVGALLVTDLIAGNLVRALDPRLRE